MTTNNMTTLEQAHSRDAHYFGNRGNWLIVLGKSRDSEVLENCNFTAALESLGGEGENVAIERSSHWACGWVEYLVVNPASAELVKQAEDIRSFLEDYPVLDEEALSKAEHEEYLESWDSWGRMDYLMALKSKLKSVYFDGISEDFDDDDLFDALSEMERQEVDDLRDTARRSVGWEYQTESGGVCINIEGLAKSTNLDSLIDTLIEICRSKREVSDIRKLGTYLGACDAEQALAVQQNIKTVSGYRQLMQGMI